MLILSYTFQSWFLFLETQCRKWSCDLLPILAQIIEIAMFMVLTSETEAHDITIILLLLVIVLHGIC